MKCISPGISSNLFAITIDINYLSGWVTNKPKFRDMIFFLGGGTFFEAQVASSLTWSDTQLPKLRAGGQGSYLRSLDHLGWSSEVKE